MKVFGVKMANYMLHAGKLVVVFSNRQTLQNNVCKSEVNPTTFLFSKKSGLHTILLSNN